MPWPNPVTKLRHAVDRFRTMSDDLAALRRELAELRAQRVPEILGESRDEAHQEFARIHREIARIHRETARIHDVAAHAAARSTLQRRSTRIVFLIHNRDAWDAVGEVIAIMQESADFDPIVISIPHLFSDDAGGEGEVHEFLTEQHVPHLRIEEDRLASASVLLVALDPDVVFRQSQWDDDIDPAFSSTTLAWTRLALITYETMNPTVNVPFGNPPVNSAVDLPWHRAAWLVFCANAQSLAIARRESITGGRQFRAVGHPKADALRRTQPDWPLPDRSPRAARVAWSAHHSILTGWNDFGTFPRVHHDMLAWAREAPDVQFVFMHHPLLPGTIEKDDGPITLDEFEAWIAQWDALPNATIWRGPYAPILAAADVLLTDGPSMITESQILATPTVFLERADHIPFNTIGERIVTGVHRVTDAAAARRTVTDLLRTGQDPLANTQAAVVDELFGAPGAAVRIVETIRAEVAAERGAEPAGRSRVA